MKKTRVAINGLGRIGRAFLRVAQTRPEIEIVAVNDLGDMKNIAYLLQYDTAYGKADFDVTTKDGFIEVNGKEIIFLSERDPSSLPWEKLEIDIVVEATGVFASYAKSKVHLDAGAKRVVVSAPVKDSPEDAGIVGATVLMGVNDIALQDTVISSNASCTTNAGSPLIQILNENLGIEKAVLNSAHGYTATQSIVDAPNKKDFRKGRAGAQNIIPSTTGAAIATTKAITDLEGKFDGIALRVPVISGSIADVTFISKKDTSVEEINNILKKAAKEERWKNIFSVTEEPLVSSDIVGSKYASIADLALTRVGGGNLVKVMAWYDNEMGYTHALVEHVITSGKYI